MANTMRLAGAFALVTILSASVETASAQGPTGSVPNNPPAYSPYLNLTRRGNSAAANYFGLVRPELDFRRALRGPQLVGPTQMNMIQEADARTGLPVTGHAAVFMNTGGYFLSNGSGTNPRNQNPSQAAARVTQQNLISGTSSRAASSIRR
jgi:hypothetical protein